MTQFFVKIAKLALWVLVPTLFISGTKLDNRLVSTAHNYRDYNMQITGNLNNDLSGKVDFETSIVTTSKGVSFSTLKLKFDNQERFLEHSMEFLISKENTSGKFKSGTYEITRRQEGLLNYFDGVFGYANIDALGELPLFAKSGRIEIEYVDDIKVQGRLSVQMGNSIGNSVQIKGDFIATK